MKKRPRPFDRLIERLRTENGLVLPDGLVLRRLYPGYWQRAGGAASWCAMDEKRDPPWPVLLGFEPVRALVKAKRLEVGTSGVEWTVDSDNR